MPDTKVATRPRILLTSGVINQLARLSPDEFDIEQLDDHRDRDGWLAANGTGIRAILTSGMERLDAARLDKLPQLEVIAVIAAGMAGIDLEAARQRGIAVTNAGDINAGDVADYAVTMLLAQRRELMVNDAYVRSGAWTKARRPWGRSISKERVGIVGLGYIGQAVAERLVPFGCELAWWGPRAKPDLPWQRFDDLASLAEWSSTLVIAARGDDTSRRLINREIIDKLGPDGLLVNVARGFVIDEPEMIAALTDGRLGAAALDVFDREPSDGTAFAHLSNVLLAPQVAGATSSALAQVVSSAVENVRRQLRGDPLRHRVV